MDRRPLRRSERAALYATALLTLSPARGRSSRSTCWRGPRCRPPSAWAAAALWPLAPAANLFQPVADTTYPSALDDGLGPGGMGGAAAARPGSPDASGLVPGRDLGLRDGLRHDVHAGVPAGRLDRRADSRHRSRREPAVAGRADRGDGGRIPGVRAGRLARLRGQPVRRLGLEPAPSRAVLRRVSPDVLALALGQRDRAGDRHRPADDRLVRRRPARSAGRAARSSGPRSSCWCSST